MKGYNRIIAILVCLAACILQPATISAQTDGLPYLCEIGLQGGCGYYVGDAAPHIFMNPREAYGIHFRYKFTKRWAVQAKFSGQRIVGNQYTIRGEKLNTQWSNRLYNVDVMGEFNFLRFGDAASYDRLIRPYTPYIFLGLGIGMYGDKTPEGTDKMAVTGYVPLGIGFKWKFAEFVGLNIAWQHNIYFTDRLEGQDALGDKHALNGWNWMNCDLTGMITAGIVFEFGKAKKSCRICNW